MGRAPAGWTSAASSEPKITGDLQSARLKLPQERFPEVRVGTRTDARTDAEGHVVFEPR